MVHSFDSEDSNSLMDDDAGGGLLRPDRRYVIAQTVSEEQSTTSAAADEAGGISSDNNTSRTSTASGTASGSSTSGSSSGGSPSRRKLKMNGPVGDLNAMSFSVDDQDDEAKSGGTGVDVNSSSDDDDEEEPMKDYETVGTSPKSEDLNREKALDDVRELGDGSKRGIGCIVWFCICCCCLPAIITAIVLSIHFTRGLGRKNRSVSEPQVVVQDPSTGTVLDSTYSPTILDTASPVASPISTILDTASPVAPPVSTGGAPFATITASPIAPQTASPVTSPTASPVASPTSSPVEPPSASPVEPPTTSPVEPPTASPVEPPTASPVEPPTESPVEATASPMDPLAVFPLDPPTASPATESPTGSPVASPTAQPLSEDADFLLAVLSHHTQRGVLLDSSTPQGKAFEQVLTEVPNQSDPRILSQRYALMTLAYATNVDGWRRRFGWNSFGNDICLWAGVVTCRNIDGYLAVASLDLSDNKLKGELPSEICILGENLESLDLSLNQLGGSIPGCLVECVNMESLSLAENKFSGPLPKGLLTTLSLLETLDLSYNALEDGLDNLFDSSIDDKSIGLEIVNLAGNELTGTIPEDFSDFPSLISLHLTDNFLSGEVELCESKDAPSDIQVDCDAVACTCCSNCS